MARPAGLLGTVVPRPHICSDRRWRLLRIRTYDVSSHLPLHAKK